MFHIWLDVELVTSILGTHLETELLAVCACVCVSVCVCVCVRESKKRECKGWGFFFFPALFFAVSVKKRGVPLRNLMNGERARRHGNEDDRSSCEDATLFKGGVTPFCACELRDDATSAWSPPSLPPFFPSRLSFSPRVSRSVSLSSLSLSSGWGRA